MKASALRFCSAFLIPLNSPTGWQHLEYRGIPSNQVKFSQKGLEIQVKNSASPLVYALKSPMSVSKLKVKAQVRGQLTLPENLRDGSASGDVKTDDSPLRIGLVREGDRKLGWLEKLSAPKWVKALFDLGSQYNGIEDIEFFTVVQRAAPKDGAAVWTAQAGWSTSEASPRAFRTHPKSKLIRERVARIWTPSEGHEVGFEVPVEPSAKYLAVWISVDGDDTKSVYDVTISDLELESATPK